MKNYSDDQFDTSHLKSDLKERSIKGSFISVGARGINVLIQLGSTAILARLLTPKDFGLVAMVLVGLDLLLNFRDAGLSAATVQRPTIDHSQVNALFWINVGVGFTLTVVMAFLSPVFAGFYKEPRLLSVTMVIGFVFLFDGLAVQHRALLQRHMRFSALASIKIITQLVGKVTAIVLAFLGFRYWALVAMPIAISVCRAIMVWSLVDWKPGFPKIAKDLRAMIMFGMNLTGVQLVSFFTYQLDNILIGRVCGAYALGLYSRSYNLISTPARLFGWPMHSVLVPSLSILQNEPERFRRFLKKAIEKLTFFAQPTATLLIVAADEIIITLLGRQWIQAIPIFKLLGIWGFLLVTATGSKWILISLARTNRLLKWETIQSVSLSLAIILGIHWGTIGVAAAVSITFLVLKIPEVLFCYKNTPSKFRDFWTAIWRSTVASIGTGFLILFLRKMLLINITSIQLRLLAIIFVFGFLYLGIYAIIPGGLKRLKEIFTKIRYLLGTKKFRGS
jgi:O-antigen/teichoic acid export membrane protein